jgi:hypothetical protein
MKKLLLGGMMLGLLAGVCVAQSGSRPWSENQDFGQMGRGSTNSRLGMPSASSNPNGQSSTHGNKRTSAKPGPNAVNQGGHKGVAPDVLGSLHAGKRH